MRTKRNLQRELHFVQRREHPVGSQGQVRLQWQYSGVHSRRRRLRRLRVQWERMQDQVYYGCGLRHEQWRLLRGHTANVPDTECGRSLQLKQKVFGQPHLCGRCLLQCDLVQRLLFVQRDWKGRELQPGSRQHHRRGLRPQLYRLHACGKRFVRRSRQVRDEHHNLHRGLHVFGWLLCEFLQYHQSLPGQLHLLQRNVQVEQWSGLCRGEWRPLRQRKLCVERLLFGE